ncbi:MAG: hypothetical protein CVV50_00840 [Spirochaetae bacterium HGW-Spirochaetae-6]|nr:MAG: hypothetical protein CVV50_00840 [Spirochaetae bacterium HGW-Spirochaetae-6]
MRLFFLFLIFPLSVSLTTFSFAESLILKDNTRLQGEILDWTPLSLEFFSDNKIYSYESSQISALLFEENFVLAGLTPFPHKSLLILSDQGQVSGQFTSFDKTGLYYLDNQKKLQFVSRNDLRAVVLDPSLAKTISTPSAIKKDQTLQDNQDGSNNYSFSDDPPDNWYYELSINSGLMINRETREDYSHNSSSFGPRFGFSLGVFYRFSENLLSGLLFQNHFFSDNEQYYYSVETASGPYHGYGRAYISSMYSLNYCVRYFFTSPGEGFFLQLGLGMTNFKTTHDIEEYNGLDLVYSSGIKKTLDSYFNYSLVFGRSFSWNKDKSPQLNLGVNLQIIDSTASSYETDIEFHYTYTGEEKDIPLKVYLITLNLSLVF